MVVEILGHDDDVSDTNSAQFFWEDNIQCNDAEGQECSVLLPSRSITADVVSAIFEGGIAPNGPVPSCWAINGVQRVAKFKEQSRNTLAVHLAVLRLPHVDSDIVIHFNQPLSLAAGSSSSAVAVPSGSLEVGAAAFTAMLRSLRIHDWGLFSSPNEIEEEQDEQDDE